MHVWKTLVLTHLNETFICVSHRGCPPPKKNRMDKKLLVGAAHDFSSVFEFIWIQYIYKFCLGYHLKDLGASS